MPTVSVCVTLQSGKLQLAGTVAAGVPVLTSVQGCSFSVPACLRGPVLVFQAAPSPSLLPAVVGQFVCCLLYTSPSPRDSTQSRMPSSA